MATPIEDLEVGSKYTVKRGNKTVMTGTYRRRLTRHPYSGHNGRPAEIEDDNGQIGFWSDEDGYTFYQFITDEDPGPPEGGRRRRKTKKSKRRARKTRRRV